MKLFVEMTEEEYEEYKKTKSQDFIAREALESMDTCQLLYHNGFKLIKNGRQNNILIGEFQKDNKTITLKIIE